MQMSRLSEDELRNRRIADAKEYAYNAVCMQMNRKDRRTARGRMMVAQAEAASLRAEVESLRQELTRTTY